MVGEGQRSGSGGGCHHLDQSLSSLGLISRDALSLPSLGLITRDALSLPSLGLITRDALSLTSLGLITRVALYHLHLIITRVADGRVGIMEEL